MDRKITVLLQEGLDIVFSDQRRNFKATVSADNPASQAIGGFKESFMIVVVLVKTFRQR